MNRKNGLATLVLMAMGVATAWGDTTPTYDRTCEPKPVFPVPNERQMAWHEVEYYAFFHYGMNTYTGLDWGNGNESESTFAPTQKPDPAQWLAAAQSAGMKGGIAVVKHHDGFCLWPTESTDHNVTKSGGTYGPSTNIPQDFATAAKAKGMKYGFYISPWDRNAASWGLTTDNDEYLKNVFLKQCSEMKQYGKDQFEIWFDGANGSTGWYGGANTTRTIDKTTYYDMPNLREALHAALPNVVMWGLGLDLRWSGSETGTAGETCWSMVNRSNDPANNKGNGAETGWVWCPNESDAMITGSWFWKSGETLKTANTLFQMYLETVGRNCNFILNLPPDQTGSLPSATVSRCKELGDMLKSRLGVDVTGSTATAATDLAKSATVTASTTRTAGTKTFVATNLNDDDKNTYWAAPDGQTTATLTFDLGSAKQMRYLLMQEYIRLGQRIESFSVQYSTDGNSWTSATSATCTTVGYKRILPLGDCTTSNYGSGITARYLRVNITSSRACPTLHTVSIY